MKKRILTALMILMVVSVTALVWRSRASAVALFHPCPVCESKEKVEICHVDGRVGSFKCQTLSIPGHAACTHINNGQPEAGHENDFCGPCTATCRP